MAKADQEIFLEIYRQHWEDVRHLENERLTFTTFYALIVAGVLGFMSQAININPIPLLIFLIVFSFFGLAISLRLRAAITSVEIKIREAKAQMPDELKQLVVFGGESGWTTKIRLREIFPAIYFIALCLFIYMICAS